MQSPSKANLLDLDREGLENWIASLGFKPFHGRQILKWIHKHGVSDIEQMTDLGKHLRGRLLEMAEITAPAIVSDHGSADGTHKWLMSVDGHNRIECVFIPENERTTVCVSSQAGCALDCAFCSTARQGFNRNLTVGEIIGQVWQAKRAFPGQPITNVVLMGMGEPLANLDPVITATRIMQDDLAYGISKYRVTLSTAGLVPGIYRLGELSNISLAVSLHAATDALRDQLVPINQKYPLAELMPACRAFVQHDKRRKITFEYIMLRDVNDSDADARALVRLLQQVPSKVNLIPFNPFPGAPFERSTAERIERFRAILQRSGFTTITRRTRGDDIAAACGQLVGHIQDKSRREHKRPQLWNSEWTQLR